MELISKANVETILTRDLSEVDALAIGELLVQVWPKPDVTAVDRAAALRTDRGDADAPGAIASRSLVIRDGQEVIGHALVFPRTIATIAGELTIAALASVCTKPECRGQKLGELLVHAAWKGVDDRRLAFSLFQTSERASKFYLRLGATFVANRIFDSTADDPQRNPFKDSHIMRYPADRPGWPEGDIDLRGRGY